MNSRNLFSSPQYILNLVISFFVTGLLGFLVFLPTIIDYNILQDIIAGEKKLAYVLFCIIIISGIGGIYFEMVITNNKIVLFFQRSIKRKLILLLAVIFCVIGYLHIRIKVRFRYMNYGYQIVDRLLTGVQNGMSNITVDIPSSIKYLIVTEQYGLSEKALLSTGIIGKNLARAIASKNAVSEGTYLHLVGKSRILATVTLPAEFSTSRQFVITRTSGKVTFQIRRKSVRDKYGRVHERYIIDGLTE